MTPAYCTVYNPVSGILRFLGDIVYADFDCLVGWGNLLYSRCTPFTDDLLDQVIFD
jgi:hypothetical protein